MKGFFVRVFLIVSISIFISAISVNIVLGSVWLFGLLSLNLLFDMRRDQVLNMKIADANEKMLFGGIDQFFKNVGSIFKKPKEIEVKDISGEK